MSTRALRKLRGADLPTPPKPAPKPVQEEDEEESEEEAVPALTRAANAFSLLNDSDDNDVAEEEREAATATNKPAGKGKGKGGGKKGKKGKKKADSDEERAEAAARLQAKKDAEEHRLLDQLIAESGGGAAAASGSGAAPAIAGSAWDRRNALLAIDSKHLFPDREMRRLFGSRVVNEENRRRERHAGGRAGPSAAQSLRKTTLTRPKEWWPRFTGGISMEPADSYSMDGCVHFRYVWSAAYREAQADYESCVRTHDPNTIAQLVQHHPCHVDGLLQLSEIYKYSGELDAASELLDRALYCLEAAWHPQFKPATGACRLDFAVLENKAIFQALFRRVQMLGRGGCSRTSLETARLLLALDPESDPMGVMQCIDYFAIRSGEHRFLLDLVTLPPPSGRPSAFGPEPPLFLPSLLYACAYAFMRIARDGAPAPAEEPALRRLLSHTLDPASPAPLPSGLPLASACLRQAVLMYPGVVRPLIEKCNVKVDSDKGPKGWAALFKRPLFDDDEPSESVEHLTDIFVERSYSLWKDPQAQELLKAAGWEAAGAHDGGSAEARRARAAVAAHWPATQPNAYGHLHAHDFGDRVTQLPPPEAMPDDNFFAFARGPPPPADPAAAGFQALPGDASALYLFLASLMPWNAPAGAGAPADGAPPPDEVLAAQAAEAAEALGAAGAGGGAGGWLEALRQLLQRGRPEGAPAPPAPPAPAAGGPPPEGAAPALPAGLEAIEDVDSDDDD